MILGPWFKCYPSDWLTGMRDMDATTQAFYVQMIFRMYEHADAIYADERTIGRWCNSNARPWRKVRENLVSDGRLVELSDGGLINPRALKEMLDQSKSANVPTFVRERLEKLWGMFCERIGKDSRNFGETCPKKPKESNPLIEARSQKPEQLPSEEPSARQMIWSVGLDYLTDCGVTEKAARGVLGKAVSRLGDDEVWKILEALRIEGHGDPLAYLMGCSKNAPASKPAPRQASPEEWRIRVKRWCESGRWVRAWGHPPDSEGTQVPDDVLEMALGMIDATDARVLMIRKLLRGRQMALGIREDAA